MDGSFNLGSNNVLDTASEIRMINDKIIAAVDALQVQVKKYVGTNVGETADMFRDISARQDIAQQEMQQHIGKAAPALETIVDTHRRGDLQGAQAIGGVPY
jgi:uncharacterized protein YukE